MGLEPLLEVVSLQHPRHRHRARQAQQLGEVQFSQPLRVETQFGAAGVENPRGLLEERLGVAVDLLVAQHRTLTGAPRGVAHPRGVVADDHHADVALLLECAHPLERNRVSDVDIASGWVDPELDPQRAAQRELLLEPTRGQHLDGSPHQLVDCGHDRR